MDIFFYEAFEEEAAALQRHLPNCCETGFTWKSIQETDHAAPPAPIISVRTQSRIPSEWTADLSGILTRSTGYDHIKRFRKSAPVSIPAGYLPRYCIRAVAEQAMLIWTALLRRLTQQTAQLADFNRDGLTGGECQGRTLLVAGVGNIGGCIARLGSALDMRVIGVDREYKWDDVSYVGLDDGLREADIIVAAMDLNETNCNLFNYSTLKKAKRGALFINVARGELTNAPDLLRLLDEEHLNGVGLDVFNDEASLAVGIRQHHSTENREAKALYELNKRPNVLLTPHNAFNTAEALERKAAQSIEQLKYFSEHGRFKWCVPNSD